MPFEEFTPLPMPAFDLSLLPPEPDLTYELPLWQAGLTAVAGIDEAGRGALAGPVAAAAVILPAEPQVIERLHGVRDSKQLTAAQREATRKKILNYARAWGVGFATSQEIDQIGILPATRLAVSRALDALSISPSHLLLDYLHLPAISTPQTALVKGDCRSLSIAAASILAKTSRDAVLRDLDLTYPGYGFAKHKGYGTRSHRDAIRHLGACPAHRFSFDLLGETIDLIDDDQG
jgi:ribonuclease HII